MPRPRQRKIRDGCWFTTIPRRTLISSRFANGQNSRSSLRELIPVSCSNWQPDTLLTWKVAEDVTSMAKRIDSILLRLLITDTSSKVLRTALPAPWRHNGEGFYGPPATGFEETSRYGSTTCC